MTCGSPFARSMTSDSRALASATVQTSCLFSLRRAMRASNSHHDQYDHGGEFGFRQKARPAMGADGRALSLLPFGITSVAYIFFEIPLDEA